MRWARSTRTATLIGVWILVGAIFSIQLYFFRSGTPQAMSLDRAFLWEGVRWLLWVPLYPLILRLLKRIPFQRERRAQHVLAHGGLSALVSVFHIALFAAVYWVGLNVIYASPWEEPLPKVIKVFAAETLVIFRIMFTLDFHVGILVYWVIVVLVLTLDYYRRTARLETQLAQAQLEALKMQLQPHFLFNTLTAIAELMHVDVEKADAMLTRLSELLRMTLQNVGAQEVPLQQELGFLERYLDIERIRFGDRLNVEIQVPNDLMQARVPALLLQPIVENAVRHGFAQRVGKGTIRVAASRSNGRVQLMVEDDGPGMQGNVQTRTDAGVGLTNTKARLEQLYGGLHSFELRNREQGGLAVVIVIPQTTIIEPRLNEDERDHR